MKAIGSLSVFGSDDAVGEADFTRVCRIDVGKDLDQRRLAGAVLPEQRMHLAAPHVEIDSVERERCGETLGQAGHGKERRIAHAPRCVSMSAMSIRPSAKEWLRPTTRPAGAQECYCTPQISR